MCKNYYVYMNKIIQLKINDFFFVSFKVDPEGNNMLTVCAVLNR